jgi:hypothetical protein
MEALPTKEVSFYLPVDPADQKATEFRPFSIAHPTCEPSTLHGSLSSHASSPPSTNPIYPFDPQQTKSG